MNLQELKERVFRLTNNKFTDEFHMVDLINDALNQLVDIGKIKGKETIEVSKGNGEYDLPELFKAPYALIEGDVSDPVIYPLINMNDRFGYVIYGDVFYLKPLPNENKTLTMFYYKYASRLENPDDVPEIDSQWHDLLAMYAAGMIMLLPDLGVERGLSDRILGRWDEGKRQFESAMMRKNKQSSVREKVRW